MFTTGIRMWIFYNIQTKGSKNLDIMDDVVSI